MNWYVKVLENYAVFNGRARRKEYWMFFLFNSMFAICAMVADAVLGLSEYLYGNGLISMLYALAMFIPGTAVCVRRLHDVGKSGWWIFINFIPIAGIIWCFILLVTEGEADENKYGENPKLETLV
jgi:uncharacterized membrane protein YhaH (DUF805 family)